MALNLIRTIPAGGRIPSGFGVAWATSWHYAEVVCMPVPFNVLARVLRDAWLYLSHPSTSVPINPRAAYWKGYREGAQAGALDKEPTCK